MLDPNLVKSDSVVIIVGKRNAGKSVLVRDLIWHKRFEIPSALVFSPTESVNNFYKELIPDSFVYDELDIDAIEKAIKRQTAVLANPPPVENFNPTLLMVFDDCMTEKKQFNHKWIRYLFLNGRHHKIFLIVNVQYTNDLPKSLRQNSDFIFCLKDNTISVREILFKQFFGCFRRFAEFDQVMQYYTDKYGCLVMNNLERSGDILKTVYWYRANRDIPRFRLDAVGDMWKFHQEHYVGGISETAKVDWDNPTALATGADSSASAGDNKNKKSGSTGAPSSQIQPFILRKYDRVGNLVEDD